MECMFCVVIVLVYIIVGCGFFFQAGEGIRDVQESRGVGDMYRRQM